jgi:hypothetical protein
MMVQTKTREGYHVILEKSRMGYWLVERSRTG